VVAGGTPIQAIVRELPFRADSEAAENDVLLDEAFIRTSFYDSFCFDDVDVIQGRKGTGKSAIFHRFASGEDLPDEVIRVPVNHLGLSRDFGQLVASTNGDEYALRHVWSLLLLVLAVMEMAALFKDGNFPATDRSDREWRVNRQLMDQQFKDLLRQLREKEIPFGPGRTDSLIDRIKNWVTSVRPLLTVDEQGLPQVALAAAPSREQHPELVNITDLAHTIDELLTKGGRRLWIVVDNLDEIFDGLPRDLEAAATRALFRSHLDISAVASDRLRTKLLVREDVFSLLTRRGGLPGTTRMRRMTLRWTQHDLDTLVATRALSSTAFRRSYGMARSDVTRPAQALTGTLLPRAVDGASTLSWLAVSTRDGTGFTNPRNVLTLLSEALRIEARRPDVEHRWAPREHVLNEGSLSSALNDVSAKRYEDTVIVEYEAINSALSRLSHGPATYPTGEELARRIRVAWDAPEFTQIEEELIESGVLVRDAEDGYAIAPFYRPAMRVRTT
jgi:hypothetical protein